MYNIFISGIRFILREDHNEEVCFGIWNDWTIIP